MESNIEKAVEDIKLDTVEDRIETAQNLWNNFQQH